jgi:hypothetical protein
MAIGTERFQRAVDRCVAAADAEGALREQLSIPRAKQLQPNAADATRREVEALAREARAIDERGATDIFVALVEAGGRADTVTLNALRESAWRILSTQDATSDQVWRLFQRIRAVGSEDYKEQLDAFVAANDNDDTAALNTLRTWALDQLSERSSAGTAPNRAAETCTSFQEAGFLTVCTVPWSEIFVNGKRYGTSPVARIPLLAGCATIRAVDPRTGREVLKNATIRPNRTTIVKLSL